MSTVYRNGHPPKKMPHKKVRTFSDIEFNEEVITNWCRDHLEKPVQYDFTVFNGSKGKLNRSVELIVWFQSKADAQRFAQAWK